MRQAVDLLPTSRALATSDFASCPRPNRHGQLPRPLAGEEAERDKPSICYLSHERWRQAILRHAPPSKTTRSAPLARLRERKPSATSRRTATSLTCFGGTRFCVMHPLPNRHGQLPSPACGRGVGGEGCFCPTHKRNRSSTASVCCSTSWFQKRSTVNPCSLSQQSRRWS